MLGFRYNMRSGLQWTFTIISVVLIAVFLYFSDQLVRSLEKEERGKMEIWADAYHQLLTAETNADMSLVLKVIDGNKTIPVFYTEADGTLLGSNNIDIPVDTTAFIKQKREELTQKGNFFEINILPGWKQYLYYDESILLHQLHYYPYVQLMVVIVFILLFYVMILSRKRAEQNRVWVGLSKETAHQLGTPISSLMGWIEYMRSSCNAEGMVPEGLITSDVVEEMDKDVQRLHTVADRFSKIGSMPKLEETELCSLIENVATYMQKRASSRISISTHLPECPIHLPLCAPLFAWVIENLCRNSIDALNSEEGISPNAFINIHLKTEDNLAIIEVEDNGKGIPKNMHQAVFNAGYTTKQRGWGLGLTLVRRIVEEYHHGRIFVKNSVIGGGTTFRIELKTTKES